MSAITCPVCGERPSFRWTDTHGVAVCQKCGAPHTLYHYDPATKERLDKPPEIALNPLGLELARRYWTERKAMVFPASYDMGFSARRETSYSGATQQDERAFYDWLDLQPEAKPVQPSEPATPTTKCADGQLPDGPICPACGGTRGPSGVDGGTWVHTPGAVR